MTPSPVPATSSSTSRTDPGRAVGPVLYPDEAVPDTAVVSGLVRDQFPEWAGLAVTAFPGSGTDNAIFRIGTRWSARFPRVERARDQVVVEHEWLPRIGPLVPLAVPRPVALGSPGRGYPWPWSVHEWLAGEPATPARVGDVGRAAADLGRFVAALGAVDPSGGPAPGARNSFRGGPLGPRDGPVRAAIAALAGTIDTGTATRVWEHALGSPLWDGPPRWLHGDLHAHNLLTEAGRLHAVIDFGCLAAGDPACDLMVAWTYLPAGAARDRFRDQVGPDEPAWSRGRGWALSMGLIALPFYRGTNPVLAATARAAIDAVLDDPGIPPRPR